MTAAFTFRFFRRLLPSRAAVGAAASAATIAACATSASPLAAATSYLPDDLANTYDAGPPATAPDVAPGSSARAAPAPQSPDALARLLEEGEAAYRARRHDEALAVFQRVVAIDPAQTQAWLRLGNLHHRRGKWFEALSAYRRVAARGSGDGVDASLRAKALYNLALINLDLAQQSLRTLERIGPAAAAAGEREPLSEAVQSVRRRLDVFGEAEQAPRPAARSAAGSAARSASRSEGRPETRGDASARSAPNRSSGTQDELPRVDYFRGAPKP